MKKCLKCNIEKDEKLFGWRNQKKGWRKPYCYECSRIYDMQKYYGNHEKRKSVKRKNSDASRSRARDFVAQYLLEHPCIKCNERDIRFLEFDHLNVKNNNISDLIRTGCSVEKIKQEIELCQILCVKCHRLKSLINIDSWRIEAYNKYQRGVE